jgi:hypothetical protein
MHIDEEFLSGIVEKSRLACGNRSHGAVIECRDPMTSTVHIYEVRLRKDLRGVDLISDALPFGRL